MARKLLMNIEAKNALEIGVNKVANTVNITLGPKGRNVLIDRSNNKLSPLIINDGISIAREIELEDPFENMGARLIIEAATKTNEMIGDGTTTAIVLTQAIVQEGLKNMVAGANPILIRNGMKKASSAVIAALNSMAWKITTSEQIKRVATISSKNEEIGEMIAKAMESLIREDGFITIEDSNTMETELEIIQGMRLKTGYISKAMCTDRVGKKVEFMQPYILIADKEISDITELLPLLEKIVNEKAQLLIIARDVIGDALNTIVLNKAKGIIQVAAIKATGYGRMQQDLLQDLAVFTGGIVVDELAGMHLKDVKLGMLGRAKSVQVQKENTIILGGYGDNEKILDRTAFIREKSEESDSVFDKERYRERISKLSGGIAVIKVGASSELEANEKKLRIEDAIASTKAAIKGGVVPGGGSAYIYSQVAIDEMIQNSELDYDELTGAKIIKRALERLLWQIASNAGLPAAVIVAKQKTMVFPVGFDAEKEEFVDMEKQGILDPVNVEIKALECAVSVASTLLTSEAVNIIVKGTESMPTR